MPKSYKFFAVSIGRCVNIWNFNESCYWIICLKFHAVFNIFMEYGRKTVPPVDTRNMSVAPVTRLFGAFGIGDAFTVFLSAESLSAATSGCGGSRCSSAAGDSCSAALHAHT